MKNFAQLDKIEAEEKRKAIEIAKKKRLVRRAMFALTLLLLCSFVLACCQDDAKRNLDTALQIARRDMEASKLRAVLMDSLNKVCYLALSAIPLSHS